MKPRSIKKVLMTAALLVAASCLFSSCSILESIVSELTLPESLFSFEFPTDESGWSLILLPSDEEESEESGFDGSSAQTGDDPTNEDPTNEDPTNEDPTSEDPTNEDPTSEDPTSEPDDSTTMPEEPEIPFTVPPAITVRALPAETFKDDLEREASAIIDQAIMHARAYVEAMRDDRHSKVTYPYEEDPNGAYSALNDRRKKLYDLMVEKAEKFEEFTLDTKTYGEDLIVDYLTVYPVLVSLRPDLMCYFDGDPIGAFDKLSAKYFDPRLDANYSVKNGKADLDDIRHQMALMDRVIERAVRFMPEGLSAYDRYYYLAAVVDERATYDGSQRNCFTAYGALIGGKAVCEGYKQAFQLLCRKANLFCGSRAGLPRNEGHAWNYVKLQSGTYNVDVTWSDNYEPYAKKWYRYFVKSEAGFVEDGHAPSDKFKVSGSFEPSPYESEK